MNKTERNESIIRMYRDGKTYKDMSELLQISTPTILSIIKMSGIEVGKGRYPDRHKNAKYVDLNFFEEIDTKEKAYVLGLIYSDGSIDKNGYGFSLSSKDYEQISLFKELLKSQHKISHVKSFDNRTGKTNERYCLHITSKKITSDLLKLGLTNSKSFNCNFPNINEDLIWHLIRGLFDGDGCIHKTGTDGRLSYYLILSGELKDKIKDFFNVIGLNSTKDRVVSQNDNGIIYSLKYSSYKDLKNLYDNMYYQSEGLRLERKYQIFSTLKEHKRGSYVRRKLHKIYQYDKNNNLVNIYEDINKISDFFNKGKVYKSLKENKPHKGFYFKYKKGE